MNQGGDFRSQCHFGLGTKPTPRTLGLVHKELKELKKNSPINPKKADKGTTTVIMNKSEKNT